MTSQVRRFGPRILMEADDAYPAADSPWTLYFNGEAMPRWASQWCMLQLLGRAQDFMSDWDEPVAFPELWRLHCRIDHLGNVQSEDPDTFQVCCLTLALLMHRDEAAILEQLAMKSETPADVFAGVREGLLAMYQRSKVDGIAFWTNGYGADRARLCDFIRCHRLPQNDPEWLEAPHLRNNRSETQRRAHFLREELRSLDLKRPISTEASLLIREL